MSITRIVCPAARSRAAIALAAEDAATDPISLVNTFLALAIDVETRRPKLGNVYGGLSGPAIKPIALRMVHQVATRVRVPVIGIGGIMTGGDVLEFLIAKDAELAVKTMLDAPRTPITHEAKSGEYPWSVSIGTPWAEKTTGAPSGTASSSFTKTAPFFSSSTNRSNCLSCLSTLFRSDQ